LSKKRINGRESYKKHKTYLINEKKKKKQKKDNDDENTESDDEFVDLLSQKSESSNFSDGIGSIDGFDFKNKNDGANQQGSYLNWELVSDIIKYNDELKLDDENCPQPKIKVQDKYAEYEPCEIFNLFFTEELINHVLYSTNEYLAKERKTLRFVTIRKNRTKDYDDLTLKEFRVFIGMKIFFNFYNNNKCRGK